MSNTADKLKEKAKSIEDPKAKEAIEKKAAIVAGNKTVTK